MKFTNTIILVSKDLHDQIVLENVDTIANRLNKIKFRWIQVTSNGSLYLETESTIEELNSIVEKNKAIKDMILGCEFK